MPNNHTHQGRPRAGVERKGEVEGDDGGGNGE